MTDVLIQTSHFDFSYSFNTTSGGSKRRQTEGDPVVMSEGASYVLEHFGAPLPSMVRVVLNKVDGNLTPAPNTLSVGRGINWIHYLGITILLHYSFQILGTFLSVWIVMVGLGLFSRGTCTFGDTSLMQREPPFHVVSSSYLPVNFFIMLN